MRRYSLGFAVTVAVGSLAGCFYPADRGRLLEERLDTLSSANAQLSLELAETKARLSETVPKVDQKIAEVARALESLDKAAHRSEADIGIQFQKSVEELAQLRGQVETYLYKIGELEAALKKSGEETDRRLTEAMGAEAVKAAEAKKKADELKRPDDKKEFLKLADERAKAGEALVARQLYSEFLKKWPKDELTGEAHYGLGESYLADDKCREALFEYGKVIQEFSKSRSAPVAYLRSADCFRKLKMLDESRLALEEFLKQYPKSELVKAAKGKLAELDKEKARKATKPRK